ncbi:hypothetical protein [Alkalicoccobacillus gibsonii]|uniref:hypothetical protein n=1 Tax=Alkalicoccobacillus gibsonii TaxID=79881 RepID=UPI0019319118|nr:hypothetical protein [Alkalicoccobacillus gibsonii]MBM0064957.1 hypothetical protein [Alkalicoccobacillus gibsonii]
MKRVELLEKVLDLTEQPGKLEEAKALAASEGVHPHMHEGNSNLNENQKIEWIVGQLIDSEIYRVMKSQSTVIKISQIPVGRHLPPI